MLTLILAIPSTPALAGGSRTRLEGIREQHLEYMRDLFNERVSEERSQLRQLNFEKWNWIESQNDPCENCELVILPTQLELESPEIAEFISTLETEKSTIMKLFKTSSNDYNFLAQMAVGILGRESQFFRSKRYKFKENHQDVIDFLKLIEERAKFSFDAPDRNSRGPTQIKFIPELIIKTYGVTPDTLNVPKNAAVATVGYLARHFRKLKQMSNEGELKTKNPATQELELLVLDAANSIDYLPYLYFGSQWRLKAGEAEPWNNIYIKDMKRYMSWVEIYERPIQSSKKTALR